MEEKGITRNEEKIGFRRRNERVVEVEEEVERKEKEGRERVYGENI